MVRPNRAEQPATSKSRLYRGSRMLEGEAIKVHQGTIEVPYAPFKVISLKLS